jgi:hypothetical protein
MMKLWNLSHFDDVVPNVLTSVDKQASVEVPSLRRRRRPLSTAPVVGTVGTIVFVAAMSLTSLQFNVCGSDHRLRLTSIVSTSNMQVDRPPLAILFAADHPLKWDAEKEQEMLAKAEASIAASSAGMNESNVIHAVLREQLPKSREEALDLSVLGIKLG